MQICFHKNEVDYAVDIRRSEKMHKKMQKMCHSGIPLFENAVLIYVYLYIFMYIIVYLCFYHFFGYGV